MLGLYIKSMGTGVNKMSVDADLFTVEIYVQQGKTIENQFFIYGPKCKQIVYFWLFEGALLGFQLFSDSYPHLCT